MQYGGDAKAKSVLLFLKLRLNSTAIVSSITKGFIV